MLLPRLRYACIVVLSVYWILVVVSIMHTLNWSKQIVFPSPLVSKFRIVELIILTLLLTSSMLLQAIEELKKDVGSIRPRKFLPLLVLILVSVSFVFGYVYERDIQSVGQKILDVSTALIEETFEGLEPGEDPPNWDEQDGDWAVYDDGGNMVYYQGDNSDRETLSISTSGDTSWVDYSIDVDLKFIDGANRNNRAATIVFRYQGGNNHYILVLREYTDLLELYRHGGLGGGNRVAQVSCLMDTGVWYNIHVSISGDIVNVSVNGVPYLVDTVMGGSYHYGSVGIGTIYYGVMFDNIIVEPIG